MQVLTRYLTVLEERQLLRTVKAAAGSDTQRQMLARRDHAWMLLLRHTGIRVGTLVGLTCGDARQGLATRYLPRRNEISKGGVGGHSYLNRKAMRALQMLLAVRRRLGFVESADARLLVGRKGPGVTVRAMQLRMRYWADLAGLQVRATPHWWRHTVGQRIVRDSQARDPRGIAQAVLGHTDPRSTAIYTRPSREDIEAVMEGMG